MADTPAVPERDPSLSSQSRVKEIFAILSVFSALSTFVVALRVWTRARILRSFGVDDAVIVVAQVLTIGAAVAEGLGTLPMSHRALLFLMLTAASCRGKMGSWHSYVGSGQGGLCALHEGEKTRERP